MIIVKDCIKFFICLFTIVGAIAAFYTLLLFLGYVDGQAFAKLSHETNIRIIPYNKNYNAINLQGQYIDYLDNTGMIVFENQNDGSKVRIKNATIIIVERSPKER